MEPTDLSARPDISMRLRLLRERADLTGRALADILGWQPPKVSKIELGRRVPSVADVEAWARATNAEDVGDLLRARDEARMAHTLFKERTRRGLAGIQADYDRLVADAKVMRNFEMTLIPGLLQVPDYSRHVFTRSAPLHGAADGISIVEDIDTAVAGRVRRQQRLYDPSKAFEFLLAEPVLRWLVCPPATMRSQLDRLQSAIGVPNIRLGILPLGRVLSTAPQNAFAVFIDGDDAATAVIETFAGESLHRDEVAAGYAEVMDQLWTDAVEGEAARPFITAAIQALPA